MTISGPVHRGEQRLLLVGVERLDPDAGQRGAQLVMQLRRHVDRAPGARLDHILVHEPLVSATTREQRLPRFDLARDGHRSRWYVPELRSERAASGSRLRAAAPPGADDHREQRERRRAVGDPGAQPEVAVVGTQESESRGMHERHHAGVCGDAAFAGEVRRFDAPDRRRSHPDADEHEHDAEQPEHDGGRWNAPHASHACEARQLDGNPRHRPESTRAHESADSPAMRCVYVDLDGTLLGPGASLLRDADGGFELLGVRAIEACHRAGVEIVIFSGRRRVQVHEDARLIGQSAFIFEAGSGLVVDGELEWLTGGMEPVGELTIADQIDASGAPALLLERYPGRLEYHEPWHVNRDVSHLFRGLVEAAEVDALLREHGHGALRLVDNGVVRSRSADLAELPFVRAYHLIPATASKANAVARHMQIRGYAPEDCIAVGDSREDMGAADVVGTFWFVANALTRDPTLQEAIAGRANVRVAEASYGAGVYEAVVTTLAQSGIHPLP